MLKLVEVDKDSMQLKQPIVLRRVNSVVENMNNIQDDDLVKDTIDSVLSYWPMLLVDTDENPLLAVHLAVAPWLIVAVAVAVAVEKLLRLQQRLTIKKTTSPNRRERQRSEHTATVAASVADEAAFDSLERLVGTLVGRVVLTVVADVGGRLDNVVELEMLFDSFSIVFTGGLVEFEVFSGGS